MKKALSIMITISMLLSLIFAFNIYAAGDAVTIDGITYESHDTYCVLTKSDSKISGDVIIPSSVNFNGELLPVTSIGDNAFEYCLGITDIKIPDSVKSIGKYAFLNCMKIVSITIPNSVTNIGMRAFLYCHGLENVIIGDGVISIGDGTFIDCINLTNVTIPSSVTSIGDDAFLWCAKLTNIEVDNNNDYYTSNEGILFNKNMTAVVTYPMAKSKEAYVIPDSVTEIGKGAFANCTNLKNIKICKNISKIGLGAFEGCSVLTHIDVDAKNDYYASYEGMVFSKDMTEIVVYPNAMSSNYSIPNSVVSIGDYAFAGCTGLTNINIPDSVASIGYRSFYKCRNLTDVKIPKSVTSIGWGAFDSCVNLSSVIIPDNVTLINSFTFSECLNLESVTIPDSVTEIKWGAFGSCKNLKNAFYCGTEEHWDENVTVYEENECLLNALVFHTVHEYDDDSDLVCNICGYERVDPTLLFTVTFYDYDGSVISSEEYYYGDEINIPEDPYREEDEEGKHIFKGWDKPVTNCTGDAEYTAVYEESTTWLQGFLFEDCETYCKLVRCDKSAYGNISIPSSVTINGKELPVKSIGDEAFAGCTDITSIIIPDSVKEIGTFTFGSCTGLVSVIIGNGLERINYKAFCGCSSLENIVIGKGVTLISINAFENCTSLETIVIPDNVTEIGSSEIEYAFDIEFPYWENPGVFHNCVNLKNVIVGSGVTSFGEYSYTFSDCTSLNNIIVSEDNETYSSCDGVLFSKDMTKLIIYPKGKDASEYKIPEGVTSIAMYAFLRCSNLKKIDIPDTVTRISHGAFRDCVNLEIINIPESVTDIGLAAFSGCVKLTKINLPSGLTSIKSGTFGYTGLKNISVPDGVTTIYGDSFDLYDGIDVINTEGAFYSSDIESIIIPTSVTSIGEGAFYDCDKLKTVYYKGSEEQWKAIDISWSNEPLTNAHIIFNYSKDYLPGDCNKDGEVDNKDVVELFRYVSRKDKLEDESVYDFNGDGEVNNRDVVELFRSVSTLQKPENNQTQPDPDETGDPTDTTTDPDETRDDPDESRDDPDDSCDDWQDPEVTGEEKPIIYLYPEEKTDCSVKIDYSGKLTCTYPEYKENGWDSFTAYPDGTLVFPNGRQYYALFWEGESDIDYDFSEGYCVKGEDTAEFLYSALKKAGLNEKESNEFIIYWLPRMQNNAYNLISFQTTVYTENAKLIVTPEPDTVIRVFMAYKPLNEFVEIESQTLTAPERNGFTVVEWGGAEVK